MPVNFVATPASDLHPVAGVRWGITEVGIRKVGRKDLAVLLLDVGASVGAVFTQNKFCAAPVQICREHLAINKGQTFGIRAMVINTGNANAGTGQDGLTRAQATCIALARELNVSPEQILPFSTGVIMEPLPYERIEAGLPAAIADAKADNWANAAQAIMTTDTVAKAFSSRITLAGKPVTITGISKGAGMIRPNMATMLGFMATDACVSQSIMRQLAHELAEGSFNRVTVDGDTSTNDSFVVVASNQAGHAPITALNSADGQALLVAMKPNMVAMLGRIMPAPLLIPVMVTDTPPSMMRVEKALATVSVVMMASAALAQLSSLALAMAAGRPASMRS